MRQDLFIDEILVGHVGAWDLSSGDLIEHKIHGCAVLLMALSGDRIVISFWNHVIRVFNCSTCLLMSR